MADKSSAHAKKQEDNKTDKRLTIGLFSDVLSGTYAAEILRGVADYTREQDVNLLCFTGGILDHPHGFWKQANVLYQLAGEKTLDGLLVVSGMLGGYVGPTGLEKFCHGYHPLPVVSLATLVPGIPSINADNYGGMHQAVTHLIEAHDRRRIAFIRGYENHQEAEERYRAYAEALAEHDIALRPELVVPGDFLQVAGDHAVTRLFDELKVDVDAIVSANDDMAFGALNNLQKRGINVPQDIAVVGFDNSREGNFMIPPLTTVRQPVYQMGRQAVQMVLALVAGDDVPEQVTLPTRLVVRQSCGCEEVTVTTAAVQPEQVTVKPVSEESLEEILAQQREHILSEVVDLATDNGLMPEWIEKLLEAFIDTLIAPTPAKVSLDFLTVLNDLLQQTVLQNGDVFLWHQVIWAMRCEILPYLPPSLLLKTEDMWQQAQVVVGEKDHWMHAHQALQVEARNQKLYELDVMLDNAPNVSEVMAILAQELPRLNIEQGYLALYENPQQPVKMSKLVLAYDQHGPIKLKETDGSFFSGQLVPLSYFSQAKRYSFIVEPLYFRENQLGFVLLAQTSADQMLYELLRVKMSSVLQAVLIAEKYKLATQTRTKQIKELELMAQISASMAKHVDTRKLLQQVVDLTKDQFNLYHANFYLLDEGNNSLVLTAGADIVGRQLVTKGWNIPLRQMQSLVAQAARTKQVVVENQVRGNPNRLPEPLLPNTQSELAMPVMIGEQVLGVLDVQANSVDGFSEDEVRVYSTLAAQVAVALENARISEQQQTTRAFMDRLYQAGRHITLANNTQEVLAAMAEAAPKSNINRMVLFEFEYDDQQEISGFVARANWHDGRGTEATPVGTRYQVSMFPAIKNFLGLDPVVIDDIQHDQRLDDSFRQLMQQLNIRSMAMLPLWAGSLQRGLILLQAENVYQLSQEEIRPYVSLLGQVSMAIENQRLLVETNAALTEVEATQRRYTIQAWEEYWTKQSKVLEYEKIKENLSLPVSAVPADRTERPGIQPGINNGEDNTGTLETLPVVQDDRQEKALSTEKKAKNDLVVPLKIRGEVIGVLGIENIANARKWSSEEVSLVQTLAQQIAQAAENLRLIDETQQLAARETRANEIGDKIRGAQSLEEALQIAVREVGKSLNTPQTAVQLKVAE